MYKTAATSLVTPSARRRDRVVDIMQKLLQVQCQIQDACPRKNRKCQSRQRNDPGHSATGKEVETQFQCKRDQIKFRFATTRARNVDRQRFMAEESSLIQE